MRSGNQIANLPLKSFTFSMLFYSNLPQTSHSSEIQLMCPTNERMDQRPTGRRTTVCRVALTSLTSPGGQKDAPVVDQYMTEIISRLKAIFTANFSGFTLMVTDIHTDKWADPLIEVRGGTLRTKK